MNEHLIDIAELSPFSYQVTLLDWVLLGVLYVMSAALSLSALKPNWWHPSKLKRSSSCNVFTLAATRLRALSNRSQLSLEHLHEGVALTRHALILSIGSLVKAAPPSELNRLIVEGVIDTAYHGLCSTLGNLDVLRFASSPDLKRGAQLLTRLEEDLKALGQQRTISAVKAP
jgi:hypothetical protein